jgi:hypothetical protein
VLFNIKYRNDEKSQMANKETTDITKVKNSKPHPSNLLFLCNLIL